MGKTCSTRDRDETCILGRKPEGETLLEER
jgi:hypothetical protein